MERFEIVATSERLRAVGPAWTALWEAAGAPVFQSHAWISAWWVAVPDRARRRLMVVLAWRGETLVGVLPLAVSGRRGLRLLEWAAKECTDFPDALLAPEAGPDLLDGLWRHVSGSGGFDIAYLNHLAPDAAARGLLDTASGLRLRPNHRTEANWIARIPEGTGRAWFDARPGKARYAYRRKRRALDEQGATTFRLLAPDEPVAPVLDWFTAIKRAWLAARGLPVTPLYAEGSPLLGAMIRVLAEAGLLRVFLIACAGRTVAVSINFVQGDTMMVFLTAYDPDFERASPGTMLIMDFVPWSIDHGLRTINFLCGDEAYKAHFSTECRTLASGMGARTPQGLAAAAVDRFRHRLHRRRAERAAASGEAA